MHQFDVNDLEYVTRKYPDIVGWIPDVRGAKGKINPHMTRFVSKQGAFIDVFHIKPVYYETTTNHWRPLSEITHYHGNRNIILSPAATLKAHPRYLAWLGKRCALLGGKLTYPSILSPYLNQLPMAMAGLTTTTVYPDPNPETTTVDGAVGHRSTSYTTTSTASVGTLADSSSVYIGSLLGIGTVDTGSGNRKQMDRGFLFFDTSPVSSDPVDSVTLSLADYGNALSNGDTGSNNFYTVVASTPASNTDLTTSDYNQCSAASSPTHLSNSISGTSISVGTSGTPVYTDWTLNATGESAINGSGVTKLGMRHGDDEGTDPGWSTATYNRWLPASADRSGTDGDPKLVVVHSAAGASYTLTAVKGVFTLTGQAITFQVARYLAAGVGTFTLSGQDANLLSARHLPVATALFTTTTQPASFLHNRILGAGVGIFTLDMQTANLVRGYTLSAGTSTYTLTGIDVSFIRELILNAETGTFATVGSIAGLEYNDGTCGPAYTGMNDKYANRVSPYNKYCL